MKVFFTASSLNIACSLESMWDENDTKGGTYPLPLKGAVAHGVSRSTVEPH